MNRFNLKSIISLLFILFVVFVNAQQKPYEVPTLDNSKKVTKLKLSEDFQNKKVKSSYMKGFTEKDSLFISVKGTFTLQHVMISVISKNKNEVIEIEIVKKDWKDVKRKGRTRDGLYQESFESARNFGIIIYSKKPNLPFDLIVWTSKEIIPKTNTIYYPSSEFKDSSTTSKSSDATKINSNNSYKNEKSNLLTYVIIGVLAIIVILLIMILKKKKSALVILLLLSYSLANAGIIPGNPVEMMDKANELYNMRERFNQFVEKDEHGNSTYDYLAGSDSEYLPNMDSAGQPKLPSSCLNTGSKVDNDNSEVDNTRNNRTSRSDDEIDEDNKYDDLDRPKYDKDGNAIDYGGNSTTTQDTNPFTDDGVVVQGDGLKKDKDGNPIPGSAPEGQNSQVMDDEVVIVHNIEHPKYDKDGKAIQYDTSDRPIHDIDGVPINYPVENQQTDYNRQGRPKYDKDGKAIIYDAIERPKYDKNGMAILYKDANNMEEGTPETIDDVNVEVTNKKNETTTSNSSDNNNSGSNNTNESAGNKTQNAGNKVGSAGNKNNNAGNKNNTVGNKEGCDCLEKAYDDLNNQRFKFEKLRIIYNDTKKVVDWSISFGDDVSGIHAVSGLAWQKEKQKILKSMDNFYKSYDNKYKEFDVRLNSILHEIDRCEEKLGFEDWYSKIGFIYYNFMSDKYKRN